MINISSIQRYVKIWSSQLQSNLPIWDIIMEELETTVEEKTYRKIFKKRSKEIIESLQSYLPEELITIVGEYEHHKYDSVITQLNSTILIVHQQLLGIGDNWCFEYAYRIEVEPRRRYLKRHPPASLKYLPKSATQLMNLISENPGIIRIDFYLGKIIFGGKIVLEKSNLDQECYSFFSCQSNSDRSEDVYAVN